jgi:phosphatidylserine/phosphatidylglycerophosphate/cardiolipin synthase-like enzyme
LGLIADQPLTSLQRISLLLLNVPREQRAALLQFLEQPQGRVLEPYTNTVARACYRALQCCDPELPREFVLRAAPQVTDLLERQQAAFEAKQSEMQIVATIPQFLFLAQEGVLPPVEPGSLRAGMRQVLLSARHRLDVCIPYISDAGADDLTADLKRGSRRGLELRILSLLTTAHRAQNSPGVCRLAERFEFAGARVEIRSPTDEEAAMIDAIAAMHAKLIVADSICAYLGTGNFSLSALYRALEIGVIVKGALARNLANLFDWTYTRHQRWDVVAPSW